VLSEVLPLIETAVSASPELRDALERAWTALRQPATLQDELQERQRQQLMREAEQARSRLTRAAVLFADGDIDKAGYELLREKAQGDLQAATAELDRFHVIESNMALPLLETVLVAAAGWDAAFRDGELAPQRDVLAALMDRAVPVRVGRGRYGVEVTWTPLGEALQRTCVASTDLVDRSAA
jgi:hypothetical protein